MYRYSVDNAVTYTSEDFVLFRESPFACWMERLTLENPDHGIPPDVGSSEPRSSIERQDDIVDTLRAEGRDVALIDWDLDEPGRRTRTIEAMRGGADFIVNGQLALGPLSGSANLLMRTSGYSDLGDFLYVPCDTQASNTLHSAFSLCFLADLLHSLQGQLPPQMLIIRGGLDVVPLQSEDHIYYYRAVKQRFMQTMSDFRKHRMPDPAESSHFGRWSECANEVLKQRALREEQREDAVQVEEETRIEDFEMPLVQAAAGGALVTSPNYAPDAVKLARIEPATAGLAGRAAGHTLAEQARMLTPGSYAPGTGGAAPGPTPNLAWSREVGLAAVKPEVAASGHTQANSDIALQNLEFIGSSHRPSEIGSDAASVATEQVEVTTEAPAPAINTSLEQTYSFPDQGEKLTTNAPDVALGGSHSSQPPAAAEVTPEARVEAQSQLRQDPASPSLVPPVASQQVQIPADSVKPHPLDSVGFNISSRPPMADPVIDMDAVLEPPLSSSLVSERPEFEHDLSGGSNFMEEDDFGELPPRDFVADRFPSFSDSLITSDEYGD